MSYTLPTARGGGITSSDRPSVRPSVAGSYNCGEDDCSNDCCDYCTVYSSCKKKWWILLHTVTASSWACGRGIRSSMARPHDYSGQSRPLTWDKTHTHCTINLSPFGDTNLTTRPKKYFPTYTTLYFSGCRIVNIRNTIFNETEHQQKGIMSLYTLKRVKIKYETKRINTCIRKLAEVRLV